MIVRMNTRLCMLACVGCDLLYFYQLGGGMRARKTLVSPGYWRFKTLHLMGNPKLEFIELIHIVVVGGARKVGAQ